MTTLVSSEAQEYRTFTSRDGKTVEAKVIDYMADVPGTKMKMVTIELKNGETYEKLDTNIFSSADQKYFKQWHADRLAAKDDAPLLPDAEIKMAVKKSRYNDLNDKGDPDNREVEYEPVIIFENEDWDLSYKKVGGTLVFIGQSTLDRGEFHVLYKEDFSIDLPRMEETIWEGKPFVNVYDSNPSNGSAFGAKYDGYLIVLRDKNKKAQVIEASKAEWEENYQSILDADISKAYNKTFQESGEKSIY